MSPMPRAKAQPNATCGIKLTDTHLDRRRFTIVGHALLIATGVQYRTLDVPGVAKLTARAFTTARP